MANDIATLALLEEELGREIPRRSLTEALPGIEGGDDGSVKITQRHDVGLWEFGNDCFTNHDSFGCFIDGEKVVGLALDILALPALPASVLELRHLKKLSVADNSLTSIPSEIASLSELEIIVLVGNQIRALPGEILDLGLELTMLGEFAHGGRIHLYQNPLESPPPEIIDRGRHAVATYFASIEGEALQLNEVKVLMVGDGGSGKTSLVNRLLGRDFDEDEPQTDGINIDPWTVTVDQSDIAINLWDFGGQEIMHATHQFFLSERSLYVLVLDGRKEEDPEYWLKRIESFGGDSPILVVMNKIDENPGFDVNRRLLLRKYQSIVGFYLVSCRENRGIQEIELGLENALKRVDIIGTRWPAAWFRVKTLLEQMEQPYISLDDYRAMCESESVPDHSGQDTLAKFLNDLGTVVHFDDFHLQDVHILEPRWLTGAVYRLINSEQLATGKGVLRLATVRDILKGGADEFSYPIDKQPYIIELMKKFGLCYSIDDRTILVPDLLDVQEPEIDFDYDSSLNFRIDYDFLPRSVITQFSVRMHNSIDGDLRWRSGAVLADESFQSRAVVKADGAAKQVQIFIAGEQQRDYLTLIRAALLGINRSFEKLSYAEKVLLPDNPEVSVSYTHLVRLEKEGEEDYYPDGASHSYRVKELLGSVHVEITNRSEEKLIKILEKVLDDSDTENTMIEKANSILIMQPNLYGVGINVNELVKRVFGRRRKVRQ